jgi:hypothetical protein
VNRPEPGRQSNALYRAWHVRRLIVEAHCLGMMSFTDLASIPSDRLVPLPDQLRLAVAAYLARFKGASRQHTESDLRCFLTGNFPTLGAATSCPSTA